MRLIGHLSNLVGVHVGQFALDPPLHATGEDAADGVGVGALSVFDLHGVAGADR